MQNKYENGSSTILISLLFITLVVFGLLGLTTSASELKLAKRNAEANRAFYSLDSEGVRFLSSLKELINQAYDEVQNSAGTKLFFECMGKRLDGVSGLQYEMILKDRPIMAVKRMLMIKENGIERYLSIEIDITEPLSSSEINKLCRIIEWRVGQEPFKYTDTINLWEGKP